MLSRRQDAHAPSGPQAVRGAVGADQRELIGELRRLVEPTSRGLETTPSTSVEIGCVVDRLAALARDATTTASDELSGTWKLLWTTEKETQFILKNAGVFGTRAGDVFQVNILTPARGGIAYRY